MSGQIASLSRLLDGVGRFMRLGRVSHAAAEGPACDGCDLVRVASYNIHKAIGNDGTYDPARTISVIAEIDADIIALQEADRRLGDRKGRLNLATLEKETGLTLVPLAARPMSHGWHGNALFYRRGTVIRAERLHLPHAEPRGAVLAEFDIGGRRLRVVAAHLGLLSRTRRLQMERLRSQLEAREPMPTLLCGDFNEWRPGRTNSPLERLSPLFQTANAVPSFPSRRPVFPLDRIFGWPDGLISDFGIHDSPTARRASDHLPVKAVIDLKSAGGLFEETLALPPRRQSDAGGGEILDGEADRLEHRYVGD
ncbi:endonuclease/exonuclease/phosphatase family protein [Pleomorphomonas oryzae]|uniref:endonuclease/exonuclease/phosphatase family protein n=1 Tax=Pleomorphomonas oryzae TaxID=261934 RepID=UPI001FE15603|nr:endonuclease/exonuclease/phosphatase family protein [Pleomorphomonas oryzae]